MGAVNGDGRGDGGEVVWEEGSGDIVARILLLSCVCIRNMYLAEYLPLAVVLLLLLRM